MGAEVLRFLTGSYTRMGGAGILLCEVTADGIRAIAAADKLADPTYVILSGDATTLFAVGADRRTGGGMAASYALDRDALRLTSAQPTNGRASCHLCLSRDERFLYTANYLSGSISVFPVRDGKLLPMIQLVERSGSGPNPERQEASHTHQCAFRPGTDELFVPDLGSDVVAVYRQCPETGLLEELNPIPTPPSAGPRHLVFAGADGFYVCGELDNNVYRYQLENGEWRCVQALPALPDGFVGQSATAAIRLREGRLYVSNRGHDSIAVFELDGSGAMRAAGHTPSTGRTPRDFHFAPDGRLLIANQDGGGVTLTGCTPLDTNGAVCVLPIG